MRRKKEISRHRQQPNQCTLLDAMVLPQHLVQPAASVPSSAVLSRHLSHTGQHRTTGSQQELLPERMRTMIGLAEGTSVLPLQAAQKHLQHSSQRRGETTQRTMRAGSVVRALSGAERRPMFMLQHRFAEQL